MTRTSDQHFTTPYRGYHIAFDPPPIPYRGADWQAVPDDYDEGDPRHCTAASYDALLAEIDEMEEE